MLDYTRINDIICSSTIHNYGESSIIIIIKERRDISVRHNTVDKVSVHEDGS